MASDLLLEASLALAGALLAFEAARQRHLPEGA